LFALGLAVGRVCVEDKCAFVVELNAGLELTLDGTVAKAGVESEAGSGILGEGGQDESEDPTSESSRSGVQAD